MEGEAPNSTGLGIQSPLLKVKLKMKQKLAAFPPRLLLQCLDVELRRSLGPKQGITCGYVSLSTSLLDAGALQELSFT